MAVRENRSVLCLALPLSDFNLELPLTGDGEVTSIAAIFSFLSLQCRFV